MLNNKFTLLLLSGLAGLTTCKKIEKEMMVNTGSESGVSSHSANITGKIIDLGEGAT